MGCASTAVAPEPLGAVGAPKAPPAAAAVAAVPNAPPLPPAASFVNQGSDPVHSAADDAIVIDHHANPYKPSAAYRNVLDQQKPGGPPAPAVVPSEKVGATPSQNNKDSSVTSSGPAGFYDSISVANPVNAYAAVSEDVSKPAYSTASAVTATQGSSASGYATIPAPSAASMYNTIAAPPIKEQVSVGAAPAPAVARNADKVAIFVAGAGDTDWNEPFQNALTLPERTKEEAVHKYYSLTKIATDFMSVAMQYGRTIITELSVNDASKTIKPLTDQLGGVAGGEKFIVNGILFKLAKDVRITPSRSEPNDFFYLYSGNRYPNEELASKAAGHELRHANRYFSAQNAELVNYVGWSRPTPPTLAEVDELEKQRLEFLPKMLRVPMQTIIDYRGFRLVAMPVLPLSRGRLVYGSPDAGKTVRTDDEVFVERMRVLAKHLHLKAHMVGGKQLFSAGDVEGHLVEDRRFLLDLARSMPPESATETPHLAAKPQGVFYRLLRPEFLQYLKKNTMIKALSPDACTMWGRDQQETHDAEIATATKHLISTVIPNFVVWFEKWVLGATRKEKRAFNFSLELHRRGINIRHLGVIINLLVERETARLQASAKDTPAASSKTAEAAAVLAEAKNPSKFLPKIETRTQAYNYLGGEPARMAVIEVVKRALKSMLRDALRTEIRKRVSDLNLKQATVDFLNKISKGHLRAEHFWRVAVPSQVEDRFGTVDFERLTRPIESNSLPGAAAPAPFSGDAMMSYVAPYLYDILSYVLRMCGLALTPKCLQEALKRGKGTIPLGFAFSVMDITDGSVRVKQMTVVDYAQGRLLYLQATDRWTPHAVAQRLFSLAADRMQAALLGEPLNNEASKERTIALSMRDMYLRADRSDNLVMNAIDKALNLPQAYHSTDVSSDMSVVVLPLCSHIFRMWAARCRMTGLKSHLECGGASSLKALEDMQLIMGRLGQSVLSPGAHKERLAQLETAWHHRNVAALTFLELLKLQPDLDEVLTKIANGSVEPFLKESQRAAMQQEVESSPAALAVLWRLFSAAVYSADFRTLGLLKEFGVAVNRCDAEGFTALMQAAIRDDARLFKKLMEMEPDLEATDSNGDTVLLQCIRRKQMDFAVQLIQAGSSVEVRTRDGEFTYTALMLAVAVDSLPIALALLKASADVDVRISSTGETALTVACRLGRADFIPLILGQTQRNVDERDKRRMTPLMWAAANGHLEVVKALLSAPSKPSVDCATDDGRTAFLLACENGFTEVALCLAHNRADMTARTLSKRTALHLAAIHGHLDVVEGLLNMNAKFVGAQDARKMTYLSLAAEHNRSTFVLHLLKRRGTADSLQQVSRIMHTVTADEEGLIVLYATTHGGDEWVEVLRFLFAERKVPVDRYLPFSGRVSALTTACRFGHLPVVKMLVEEFKASQEVFDKAEMPEEEGEYPVDLAAREGHLDVLRYFLIDRRQCDNPIRVQSALRHALRSRHTRHGAPVVEVLTAIRDAVPSLNLATFLVSDTKGTLLHEVASFTVKVKALRECVAFASARKSHSDAFGDLENTHADHAVLASSSKTKAESAAARTEVETEAIAKAKLLMETFGVDSTVKDLMQRTAAHIATSRQLHRLAAVLNHLEEPVDVPVVASSSSSTQIPLSEALSLHLNAKAGGAPPPSQVVSPGTLAMMYAAHSGFFDGVAALAPTFANTSVLTQTLFTVLPKVQWQSLRRGTTTPLIEASAQGHLEVVKKLLDYGAAIEAKDANLQTPLMFASKRGHDTVVQELLKRKAAINAADYESSTALSLASAFGHEAVVKTLLANGANLEQCAAFGTKNTLSNPLLEVQTGKTPLTLASQEGRLGVVKLLLAAGANLEAKDSHSWTALRHASMSGKAPIVKLLIDSGANVNDNDGDGKTSLILAVTRGYHGVIKTLVDAKCDVNLMDQEGSTALMIAASRGDTNTVRLLLAAGAQVDLISKKKQTALMKAAHRHHVESVKLLLAAGADKTLKDDTGKDYAAAIDKMLAEDAAAAAAAAAVAGSAAQKALADQVNAAAVPELPPFSVSAIQSQK